LVIRYADDFVIGVAREDDAKRIMDVLPNRSTIEPHPRDHPMSVAECKTNRGNLLQHWTLCEALNSLRGVTQGTDPLLLHVDAHAMKPLSQFTEEDEKFRRVRASRPGQCSLYERTWRALVPGDEKRYPSSAAFVDSIWDGRRAYLLCEQSPERAQECGNWLADREHTGRAFCYEVFGGDWRRRFGIEERFPRPLAALKQGQATERVVTPGAVFVSFDPNQVCCLWPGQLDGFNLYAPELPKIWEALQPLARHPTVVQISTYDTARGKNSQEDVEASVKTHLPAEWRGPVIVRVDRSMMSLLFWSDAATGVGLDSLPGRFMDWVAAIDMG
jgi:hypothetical protein